MHSDRRHGVHSSTPRQSLSRLELFILSTGVLAALASGVVTYRVVGPYGDGPFSGGFRRIPNPETGQSSLVHDFVHGSQPFRAVVDEGTGKMSELQVDTNADGAEDTRAYLHGAAVTRVERDSDGDGTIDRWEYYNDTAQLQKVGFSLAGDGVVDAWAYYGTDQQFTVIEVSTRRDRTVDRWEYYEGGVMVRVETDTTGDGQADTWSTYTNGILAETGVGSNEDEAEGGDARPDRRGPQ